jgi:hypothetical protein
MLIRMVAPQDCRREEAGMHRDDLMKSDLLSGIVLRTAGVLILLGLIFLLALVLAAGLPRYGSAYQKAL